MTEVLVEFVKLLFGQVGVIGTVCLGVAAFIGWLLQEERASHTQTRTKYEEMNDKRFDLLLAQQQTLTALKDAVTVLATKIKDEH